jgi:2-phospho-L-lactate guanylyltransferase
MTGLVGPDANPVVIAIIPVGTLEGSKSRLGAVLDAEERHDLATSLACRTISAAVATPGIAETLVITPDDEVRRLALELGARPLRQRTSGLNDGLREARAEAIAAGAEALLIVPIDVPQVTPEALADVIADGAAHPGGPLVAIVPDRHGRGTNALLLRPPDAIDFRFGGDSRQAHREAAEAVGATILELTGPLRLDIDTADDLVLAQAEDPELVGG